MFKQATERPISKQHVIDNETFVRTWVTSKSVEEVATRMEIGEASASSKATYLRNKGVKLPKMVRHDHKTEIDKLNDIIKKYSKR
jgi:hypothetical protein